MKKLRHGSSDSLELLLDTVCSMFGAILLIAILVALMARTTPVETESEGAAAEIVSRRIELAKKDLERATALLHPQNTPDGQVSEALMRERERLEQELSKIRAELDRSSALAQEKIARMSADPGGPAARLNENIKIKSRELEDLQNERTAQEESLLRIQRRIAEIPGLIQKNREARQVTLRFPKEREKTKRPVQIICKFGKVYPVRNTSGEKNVQSIRWKKIDADTDLSEPIQGRGENASDQNSVFHAHLRQLDRAKYYLVFFVYADSFDTFQTLRELALKSGIEYGLEIIRTSEPILWGENGTAPPPQ